LREFDRWHADGRVRHKFGKNNFEQRGFPMSNTVRMPRITRRNALKLAGAAASPALVRPARADDGSTLKIAFAIQQAALEPQKMRVGGVDYNYAFNCFSRLTAQDTKLPVLPPSRDQLGIERRS
jgi:hypothetical protein